MRLIDADELIRKIEAQHCPCLVRADIEKAKTHKPVIEKEYADLAKAVLDMRNAQKRYFKTRDKDALMESKQLENTVDALVNKALGLEITLFPSEL